MFGKSGQLKILANEIKINQKVTTNLDGFCLANR